MPDEAWDDTSGFEPGEDVIEEGMSRPSQAIDAGTPIDSDNGDDMELHENDA